jgi:transcription antitermination factor NusG
VHRIDSALGFVGGHGEGIPIPDEQIECVRTALAQPRACRSLPLLKVGQRVRVCGGAMDGIEGVFVSENGDQSLIISIDAIQRSLSVRIDGYQVKPI